MERLPVEIIMARRLLSNIGAPAFLVDVVGTLVFFNDAAGELIGVRYEEAGPISRADWLARFVPTDDEGRRIPADELPLALALDLGRTTHRRLSIRTGDGRVRHLEVSAFPLVGNRAVCGAMAICWEARPAG